MATLQHFPHPYYFYGSDDSTDIDVLISIPKKLMPKHQHERKALVKQFENQIDLGWNATLIVVTNGYIVDTIYPKAWVDSLNNSLWNTYDLHPQDFPNPLKGVVGRNYLLAIYKAVRTVLTMMTRTHYRPTIKPILKGIHPFHHKLDALRQIDFHTITSFHQKNTSDVTAWKTIAFYMGQNMGLLASKQQIYTKKSLVKLFPNLSNFIYRKRIDQDDVTQLMLYLRQWLTLIDQWGDYVCSGQLMYCKGECIDMKNELSIYQSNTHQKHLKNA